MKSDLNRNVTGYMGMLIGSFYLLLAVSWSIWPTNSRSSGIDWINYSPIPVDNLNATHLVVWWIVGGLVTIAGSVLSLKRNMNGVLIFSSIITPLFVASMFAAAFFGGHSPTGIVSAISYLVYGMVVPTAVLAERHIFKEERKYIDQFKEERL